MIDWQQVDWSQTDRQIGDSVGMSPAAVFYRRVKLGKPRNARGPRRGSSQSSKHKVDWLSVDWSKNDTQIAKELPVSRQAVAQMRKKQLLTD